MMKKLYLLLALIFVTAGCKKEEPIVDPELERNQMAITLTNPMATKAYFDGIATGEAYERKLNKVWIFMFKTGENVSMAQYQISDKELATPAKDGSPRVIFTIPVEARGAQCDFFAVANVDAAKITDKISRTDLLALVDDNTKYNQASFDLMSVGVNGPVAETGFAMSGGMLNQTIPTDGPLKISIGLSRTVAKMEVRAQPTADFTKNYPGSTLKVTSIKVLNLPTATPLMTASTPATLTSNLVQTSGVISTAFCHQFYPYENGTAGTPATAPTLEITADFDYDGKPLTTEDILPITYKATIKGSDNGLILRNNYYRIEVGIDGLTPNEVVTSVTVTEWNVVATQQINIGK